MHALKIASIGYFSRPGRKFMQCTRSSALDAFFQHFKNSSQPTYVSLLCCGCSTATISVAEVSHYWNVAHVSSMSLLRARVHIYTQQTALIFLRPGFRNKPAQYLLKTREHFRVIHAWKTILILCSLILLHVQT